MGTDVRVELAGAEVLDELAGLWEALLAVHGSVTATGWPALRSPAESWAIKRAAYERWLAEDPDAFVLLARRGGGERAGGGAPGDGGDDAPDDDARRGSGAILGFAMVHGGAASSTWAFGRAGIVQTLSVDPAARGQGIGPLLLDAVEAELAVRGIDLIELAIAEPNEAARRFYAREGFVERYVTVTRGHRGPRDAPPGA